MAEGGEAAPNKAQFKSPYYKGSRHNTPWVQDLLWKLYVEGLNKKNGFDIAKTRREWRNGHFATKRHDPADPYAYKEKLAAASARAREQNGGGKLPSARKRGDSLAALDELEKDFKKMQKNLRSKLQETQSKFAMKSSRLTSRGGGGGNRVAELEAQLAKEKKLRMSLKAKVDTLSSEISKKNTGSKQGGTGMNLLQEALKTPKGRTKSRRFRERPLSQNGQRVISQSK